MGNSILTNDIIVKESLMELKNKLAFTMNVNRDYDNQFAKTGAKVGDTINVRKPSRYKVTTGPVLEIQDSKDQSIPLTLDQHRHVGLAFSQKDRALSIDRFKERYIKPAVTALANEIDFYGYTNMYRQVFSAIGVPSASSLPSTLKGFTDAKAKLSLLGAPTNSLTAILDPLVESSMVEGLKGLFQSSTEIKKQYEEGVMGYAAGQKFMSSANVVKHTIGALGGTPTIKTTITADGATTIDCNGGSGTVAKYFLQGDVITIDGVYAVNPQNRQSTGQLAQFVVTSDCDMTSNEIASIPISPSIISTGQYQNVTALPIANAAIKIFGSASAYAGIVCPQNLVFYKDAFILGCADFELPGGVQNSARAQDPDAGLSLTLVEAFDPVNYRTITRLDILFGFKCVYPEMAVRVVGQPA